MIITASIVLYKTSMAELEKVCQSLFQDDTFSKVIIVDNSPDDRLKNIIPSKKVEYIFNGKNIGYGAAHNIAIRKIIDKSDYHLALNTDIFFSANVIPKIVDYLNKHPKVGLILPKVLNLKGEVQYLAKLLPTPSNLLIRLFLPDNIFKNKRTKYQLAFNGYNTTMEAPCLSGCFMFFRVEALREVGLFDERYFLYSEDFDLSRRIHEKYQTIYYPRVSITHYHHRHSYKSSRMMLVHMVNTIRYFNKWGWFFDPKRRKTNKRVLEELEYKLAKKEMHKQKLNAK
ncbi:glycosyltransferase family 2 protein [Draconibacterium orientale]|uniref:glycosyltransferase family 2 protein n=1 Tax=Draconibacterium orientale TaxID=1168034 RepID=UPI002A0A63AB|nr:glycosyltransferase family 2 protein [Draconibacterium orientale]